MLYSEQYSDMVTTLAKPGAAIIADLNPKSAHILHMAVGLVGEFAGELSPHVYRGMDANLDTMVDNDEIDKVSANFREETGDCAFYAQGLHDVLFHEAESISLQDYPVSEALRYSGDGFDGQEILAHGIYHAAQILDIAKKIAIYAKPVTSEQVEGMRLHLRGATFAYETMLALGWGGHKDLKCDEEYTILDVLQENQEKLGKRYAEKKFSNEQAQTRADKAPGEL